MEEKEKQDQAITQDQATQEQAVQQAQETPDIQKMIDEALKGREERWKKEIGGLNKKNDELSKALKEKEREALSEEERLKAEKAEAQKELEEIKSQALTARQQMIVARELYNAGLPEDFAKRITGGDDDEIKADVLALKAYLDKQAQALAEAEVKKRLGGGEPKGGGAPAGKTISEGEFIKLTATEQSKFMADGGTIGD